MVMHNPPNPGEVIREFCIEPLGFSVSYSSLGLEREFFTGHRHNGWFGFNNKPFSVLLKIRAYNTIFFFNFDDSGPIHNLSVQNAHHFIGKFLYSKLIHQFDKRSFFNSGIVRIFCVFIRNRLSEMDIISC